MLSYVLNKNNLLVDILDDIDFYSKEALKNKPKITNPVETFGFEKSCYYAALYLSELKLLNKQNLKDKLIKFDDKARKDLFKDVVSQEAKLIEYNNIKKREQEKKSNSSKARAKKANSAHAAAFKAHDAKRQSDSTKRNDKRKSSFKSLFKTNMNKNFKKK